MTLSPHADWVREISKGTVEVKFHVKLYLTASVDYSFTNGKSEDAIPALRYVAPINRQVDPISLKYQVSQCNVHLHNDEFIRELIRDYGFMGARVEITFGPEPVSIANYEPYFTGYVANPGPKIDKAKISFTVKSIMHKLKDVQIADFSTVNRHPLELAENAFLEAGLNSEWYDTAAFDPANYTASISHYVAGFPFTTTPYNGLSFIAKTEVGQPSEIINQAMRLMNGVMYDGEDGKITFERFDNTKPADAHLTADDYKDFTVISLYDNIINACKVMSHHHPVTTRTDDVSRITYQQVDDNSITRFGTVAPIAGVEDAHIGREAFNFPMVSGYGKVQDSFTGVSPGVGDWITVQGKNVLNMTGSKEISYPARTQTAGYAVSAARPAYIMVDREVIKLNESRPTDPASIGGFYQQYHEYDYNAGTFSEVKYPYSLQYKVAQRDVNSTGDTTHNAWSLGFDVTMSQAFGGDVIDRFSNGAPVVEFNTDLSNWIYQLGNIYSFDVNDELFAWYGHIGLDNTVKFQIIQKALYYFKGKPRILWRCMYAYQTSPPATSFSTAVIPDVRSQATAGLIGGKIENEDVEETHIVSGLNISATAALGFTLEAGVGNGGGVRSAVPDTINGTVRASKDTYVGYDADTGTVFIGDTSNGGTVPTKPNGTVWLTKIVSAGSISSDKDLRVFKAIPNGILTGSARGNHGVYMEDFDTLPKNWYEESVLDNYAIVTEAGRTGGNVLRCESEAWLTDPTLIPYDESKLYRIRCRVMMTQRDSGSDTFKEHFYCGLAGVADDKVTLLNRTGANSYSSQHYYCAAENAFFANNGLNTWAEYYGWFKGHGVPSSTPSTDATSPRVMYTGVTYVRPLIICNWNNGDGTMRVDYIAIDVFDEDAQDRTYNAIETLGNNHVIKTEKVIAKSVKDGEIGTSKLPTGTSNRLFNGNFDFNGWSRG